MSQTFTLCEIKQNNGKNGKPIWIVIKGIVYDVTKFLQEHPGGNDAILEFAGRDATKAFNQVGHSTDAIRDMKLYKIGEVAAECASHLKSGTETAAITTPPTLTETTSNSIPKQCCGNPENKTIKFFCCC